HRHLCLQTLLIILLVIFLITFASVFLLNLGTYILTSSAKMIQDDQSMNPSSSQPNDQILLIDPSTNMTVDVPAPLQDDTNEQEPNEVVLADWLADKIRYSNCSFLSSTVQSGQMLELCDANVDPFSTDKAYMQCFRKHLDPALWSGFTTPICTDSIEHHCLTCERRRNRNGDSEKIMKQSTDDEDDIDDPKAPLYENGFSPSKEK
ncbi:hypothetical protein BLOT_004034, partial [Blomia tropicalis]